MSRDTILGSAPSGADPGPDSVVPGDEQTAPPDRDERAARDADDAGSSDDESTTEVDDGTTPDPNLPDDARTAYHRSRVYSLLGLGFDRPGEQFQEAVAAGAFCTDLVESARAIDDDLAEVALAVGAHVDDADALHEEWTEDVFGDSGRSCGGCGADAHGVAGQDVGPWRPDVPEADPPADGAPGPDAPELPSETDSGE